MSAEGVIIGVRPVVGPRTRVSPEDVSSPLSTLPNPNDDPFRSRPVQGTRTSSTSSTTPDLYHVRLDTTTSPTISSRDDDNDGDDDGYSSISRLLTSVSYLTWRKSRYGSFCTRPEVFARKVSGGLDQSPTTRFVSYDSDGNFRSLHEILVHPKTLGVFLFTPLL